MKRNWVDGLNEELNEVKLNQNFASKFKKQRQIQFRRGLVAACLALIIMAGSAFALMNSGSNQDKIYLANNTEQPNIQVTKEPQVTQEPNVALQNDKLYRYSENGKFGYVDASGSVVIEAQFDYAMSDLNDVAVVAEFNDDKTSRKLALLDKSGNLTGYDFNYIGSFIDGLAAAQAQDGKFGIVNTKGEWIVDPAFASIGVFSGGLALASQDGKFGYIDTKGEWAISPNFKGGETFQADGTAIVKISDTNFNVIDTEGKLLFKDDFEKIYVSHDGNRWVKDEKGFGLIKQDGTWVVEPKFDTLYYMSNGGAVVANNGNIGIVNAKGESALEPTFDGYDHSGFGMAVLVDKDGQGVLFDENGQKLLGGKSYSRISIVNETMVLVALPYKSETHPEDVYWFLTDLSGNKVIDAPIEFAEDLGNGFIKITESLDKGSYLIKKDGQLAANGFDKIISFDEKVLIGTKLVGKNEADNAVTIQSVVYDVIGNKVIHESGEAILSAVDYEKVNLYTAPDQALIYGGETIPYINILESLND